MKKTLRHSLGPLVGITLFAAALWVLHGALRDYHYQDVVRQLRDLPARSLVRALGLTALSYLVLTGYDTLALRYIRRPLSYGKTAVASFIGYAFSHNLGLSLLTGGSVRYRLYSAWGLTAAEVTSVVAFCGLTFWLGFLTLGGAIFALAPPAIPEALRLPVTSARPLGIVFLLLAAGYGSWTLLRKRPLTIRGWELPVPSGRLLLSQVAVSSLDWALAGSVVYTLLPRAAAPSYPAFLGIYLLAMIAGVASQVPAGLGVFEGVMLLLLPRAAPASAILGSLLAFRMIYNFLPLAVATALLGSYEVFTFTTFGGFRLRSSGRRGRSRPSPTSGSRPEGRSAPPS
jgi:uncharacterized membrane protein YbhN (UPF0104 family)